MKKYDVIIPLGGGRNKDGSLTAMSMERLDMAAKLYLLRKSNKIISQGGKKSTYRPNAIEFSAPRAELAADYVMKKGVKPEDIIITSLECADTISEAIVTRNLLQEQKLSSVLVVTSELHLPRSLYLFKRILGSEFNIEGTSVPSRDLLIEAEEKEYLNLVREYFSILPERIPEMDFDEWFINHKDLYLKYLTIHDKYHSNGRESQAYLAVRD